MSASNVVPFVEQIEAEHELSDDTLAIRFVDGHMSFVGDEPHCYLRWVQMHGRWYMWRSNGFQAGRWVPDETLAMWNMMRKFLRVEAAGLALDKSKVSQLLKSAKVAAVELMARSDLRVAGHPSEFNADLMKLNTLGGLVDLSTGEITRATPADLCSRQTAANPVGDCPRWKQFLHEVTAGNVEMQKFLQRVAGYCLTGQTVEHAAFFFFGPGRNGKSKFVETLAYVMGDYAKTAAMSTFIASRNEQHPTSIAMLDGARLVIAGETEHGQRFAESKLKQLTGGDKISARFMYRDAFEFKPQFKLLMMGNTQPELQTVDPAIRGRLHLIPFNVRITPDKMDHHLEEKLRAEANGILLWMLEGCLEWQRIGLQPPEIVRDASADYFEEQDSLQQWLAACCDIGPSYRELPGMLFASWEQWATKAGEQVGTAKALMQKLQQADFDKQKQLGFRWRLGLRLKP
jgi:putative DNA primase/helicase